MGWRKVVWLNERGELVTNRRPWGVFLLVLALFLAVISKRALGCS